MREKSRRGSCYVSVVRDYVTVGGMRMLSVKAGVKCDGKMWKVNNVPSATTGRHVFAFTGIKSSVFNSLPAVAESHALNLRGDSTPVYGGNPRGEV